MRMKTAVAAVVLAVAGLGGPALATVDASAASHVHAQHDRHACTHTSSGSCIRGGQFCPQSSYGRSGWDAQGRRYVCKGDRTHPHWMVP